MLLFAALWWALSGRTRELAKPASVTLPLDSIPAGVSITGELIVYRDENGFRVFSARCTHLGCSLRNSGGARVVCPCHGSEFDALTGEVVRGPALKALRKLRYEITGNQVVINLLDA